MNNRVHAGIIFLTAGLFGSAYAETTPVPPVVQTIADMVTFSGLVETEVSWSRDFEKKDSSDIRLATVQFGMDASVNEWSKGHLLFLYEEDDTEPVDLDEGTITLGGTETFPVALTLGKFYLPFGLYHSNMISDPLTQELGEINQSAVQLGYTHGQYYASIAGFNCDTDTITDDEPDSLSCYAAAIGFTQEDAFAVQASYVSSLTDTDGLEGFMEEAWPGLASSTGGYSLSGKATFGQFGLSAEMVSGIGDLAFAGVARDAPVAWVSELAYASEFFGRETVFALGYQASRHLAAFLPESRISGTVGVAFENGVTAALEYAHDTDYAVTDGGTGNSAQALTMQVAVAF